MSGARLLSLAISAEKMADGGYADREVLREVAHELRRFAARQEGALRWLERQVGFDGDDCLIWPFEARTGSGYPVVGVGRRPVGAHRLMCKMAHGKAPQPRMQAAHSCGTRDCVNPKHLRWATPKDNHADKRIHGTLPLGEQRPNAKLTDSDVRAIRVLAAHGALHREIAKGFGIARETVGSVVRRKTWKHIEEKACG